MNRNSTLMDSKIALKLGWAILLGFGISVKSVSAGIPPLAYQIVSVAEPVLNEFGQPLPGTDPSSELFGIAPQLGALVHVYQTLDGSIDPPDQDGIPDAQSILVLATRIGIGASPLEAAPAKFGGVITPRPEGGTRLFVRVFNAPTLATASFYRDSQVFTVSSVENSPFIAVFTTAMMPLDPADDDGDGLNNSWEKSYGSDPMVADSDQDGCLDGEEWIAGTDPNEDSSYLMIADVQPSPPDQIILSWISESNRTYTIEWQPLLDHGQPFQVADSLSGNGDVLHHVVPVFTNGCGVYRLQVSKSE